MTPQMIQELTEAIKDLSKIVTDLQMNFIDPNQLLTTRQVAKLWGMERDDKVVLAAVKAGLPTIDLGTKGHRIMRRDAVEWCQKLRTTDAGKRFISRRRKASESPQGRQDSAHKSSLSLLR